MNEIVLPDDILHIIFRQLSGRCITRCRGVCTRWRDAVDALTDRDWEKICENDECVYYEEYVRIKKKSGLSWRDLFRAVCSWYKIDEAEMKTSLLGEGGVERFKVVPGGIVACLQKTENATELGNYCDTIVYYDITTGEQCGKLLFDFCFDPALYDENEFLQVFVLENKRLLIMVKETKKRYKVGVLKKSYFGPGSAEMTLIEKEVYFSDRHKIIYCSKLTDKNTIKTRCLEAFEKNHDAFNETVIGFTKKDGILRFISEEMRCNIYSHRNADFGWYGGFNSDDPYLMTELNDFGFDWKRRPILNYFFCDEAEFLTKNAFYSHGVATLLANNKTKTINLHHIYIVYAVEHLMLLLRKKPKRTIVLKNVLPGETGKVVQMDIFETLSSHKVLALIGKKLYVFEFLYGADDSAMTDSTINSPHSNEPKIMRTTYNKVSKVVKKKTFLAKKKGIKRSMC